jgi:hypothetical protein
MDQSGLQGHQTPDADRQRPPVYGYTDSAQTLQALSLADLVVVAL